MNLYISFIFYLKVIAVVQLADTGHSCNFENGLCSGWRQLSNDDFDWTRKSGSTPSYPTGPSSGNGGYGYYMYIETSSPRAYEDKARLEYTVPSSDVGKLFCMTLYYHMYGSTINQFNIYNGQSNRVFTKTGQQGNRWLRAKKSITLQSKVIFEGIRGSSYTGDIAIDDVSFTDGICKGCEQALNESFGGLDIRYGDGFDPDDPVCKWSIGNTGLAQPVAIVWIRQTYFYSCGEFVKVFNGDGVEIFARTGCYGNSNYNTFLEIPFAQTRNVTIQVSLSSYWSYVKIDYGTLNEGLTSASHLASWNATIANISTYGLQLRWTDLENHPNIGARFYLVTLNKTGSGIPVRKLLYPNSTSTNVTGLTPYTEYNISVIAISDDGTPYKSGNLLARTDEGVPSRAPYIWQVVSVPFSSDLEVRWSSIPQDYVNGRLLGYTVYYRFDNYWYPYESVNTTSPNATSITLKNLRPAQRYRISVAAFTSKGVGPRSYEYYATTDCALTVNQTFGEIDFNTTSYYYIRCSWSIHSAAVMQAVALVSVQELNLAYCSEYAKITDGFGKEVLYHEGCEQFATENLLDVALGQSNNISIQTYLGRSGSSIKIKFAIFKGGISSAIMASGWNLTVLNPFGTGFTLQWTQLPANINRVARFYIILVKSTQGSILDVETLPESILTLTINGRRPSTKYRVVVYGVDDEGQLYKSEESLASTTEMRCGSRLSRTRIVGGSVAGVNSWPWQVMLNSYGRQFCGGTLINRYSVVTAAHCVYGKSPSRIKVKLGAHYRTSSESVGTEQEIDVSKIIKHPNYNSNNNTNDIALIKLSTSANLGVGVGLACLPDFSHSLPFDNLQKKCWITGWGTLYSGGSQPNTLMEARVPLVSKERCDVSYPGKIDHTMLCAGFDSGGVDTCQGDSGGPLVCEFNNTWYLEGVTSWGYRCAYAGKYGIYASARYLKGWLLQNMYEDVPDPTILPHNQSFTALVWCHFDHGLCSGWNQSTSDDFDWSLYHGSTPSSSTGPTAGQGGSGYYMFIEASSPRKTGDKAKLVATVPSNGKKACLSFYYHMYGVAAGTLNVYSGSNKVFNITGNQGNNWIMVERNIRLDRSVTFEGIVGSSYTGDIAIDSVNITNGSCPVSCSFDNGLCVGWTQSKSDVFDWTLRSGRTPSWSTGPSAGHGGSGKYMYIEASSWSTGSNAKLEMAVPRNKSSCCLVFHYHMYGAAMGTLNVFSGNKKIFTKSGNQGNYWKRVSRTVYFTDLVTFEGIRGSSYTSDIAIDDVSIRDGSCPGCGGVLNKSSGQLLKQNGGDEGELRCNWTIGHAGISQAFAIFTLERVYMNYCNEHLKIFNGNGSEVFTQAGCGSSLPYGTVLEVPFGGGSHLSLNLLLEYRWSAVSINYTILRSGFDSAELLSSWNISVSGIAVSSAWVYWPSFPLSAVVSHYLVRYKEVSSGVSRLFRASSYNNGYYTNRLRGFTAYTVQVLAVTTNNGNVTYASNSVSFQTLEGVPSRAPTNVKVENQGLNEFVVTWDPVPQEYVNGRLLGYKVLYKKTSSYYYYWERVDTGNPDITTVVLPNIQTGERYQISVTAYTSRGQGLQSSYIYITKGCEGSVNQSSGWLNFTQSSYNSLNCSVQIFNAGVDEGVALIAFQNVNVRYCSEFLKIYDGDGTEVFRRRGCDSLVQGLSVEIPFNNRQRITLAVFLSRRYSAVRVQYSVLHKSLSTAQEVLTWNVTIYRITSSSLSVRWTNFPLNFTVQGFLIKYTQQDSNVSQVFQASLWYNTHYSGSVLKGYTYYQVKVIAVVITGNGTSLYSTRASLTRTNEGVPSIAPTNVRVSNLQLGEVKVQWNHIPEQQVNGRLVGYRVYYDEYPYWYGLTTVNSSGPNDTMLVLRGLKAAHYYRISVAALTRVGAGPQSSWWYITTGCGGHMNRSFGQLQIDRNRGSSYLSCSFVIGNIGISQGVAPIWIQDLYLASYYGEYVKITDGNGTLVFSQYGYATSARKKFLEVDFGSREQITIQINLRYSSSHLNLQYGIVKQSIFSALPVVNWNVTVSNISTNEITIHWKNLASLVNDHVPYYVALVSNSNGSQLNSVAVPGNKNFVRLFALSGYTRYQVSVVGIDSGGQSHSSSNVTARTDEGVPSRAPLNVRLSNVRAGEVKVQWDPLSQQYINGRLLGYTVYYQEYTYYSYWRQSVNTSSANVYMVILRGLKAAQQYRINVAAYTSKGVGPQSYTRYITTGCGGNLNQSFGQLQVGHRSSYSYLRCNWAIGNMGISQAVALVSFQELYLGSSSDYIKVIDGNGRTVLSRYGYSYAPQRPFVEAPYGNAGSISVQIYLYRYSRFKLQFGILKQGLPSAQLVANWSALISNTTTTSLRISWQNLTQVVGQRIVHFIVVIKTTNGTTLNGNIRSEQTFSDVFFGLSPYTEYRLSVVGVDEQGVAYKHSELTAWTDESVPSRGPSNISFTDVESTSITVTWNSLPRQYHNGRLLGYKVYFKKTAYYSNPSESNSSSITISNPNATYVTLTGLLPGQRYDVSVAAFTSKGVGQRSYLYYVTTVCLMTVNQSVGLIDVMQADYNALHCHWTIGNVGIHQAVALFIIPSINFSDRSEYVKIFDGNTTLQYHYNSCSSFKRGTIIEIPFLGSNNITVSIYLSQLQSSVKAQYVVLRSGLSSAPLLSGWNVTVENTTFSSIHIRWTNLTSLLNRQVRHYIVFLNMNNGSSLIHKITDGRELATDVTGLAPSSNYTVEVFGIDETGQPFRTIAEDARTKKILCGYRPSGSSRIVGGTVAPPNSWPWQAMLRDGSGRQFCGGTLIHPLWVLTATHCVSGKSLSSVKVRLGAHYRLSASVGTEQDFDVIFKIQHESYYSPNRWSNDVALLKLSRPAELGNGVGLACLSNEKFQLPFDQLNKTCWISGWGTLYYFGPQPTELMQVNLPMISWQRCKALYYPNNMDSSMLCVGRSQGGVGGCHGDSGGPLVCEFNNQWYLEGVTSWGGMPCAATGKPTVYANVRNLKSWIISKMTGAPLPSQIATPSPTSSSATCGSVVNNRLRSPRYPSNYPDSMNCVYRVPIPCSQDLNIYFHYFSLESHYSCNYDYLQITSDRNQIIGKYCGVRSGLSLIVAGSYVEFRFRSDGSVTRKGFDLGLYFVSGNSSVHPNTTVPSYTTPQLPTTTPIYTPTPTSSRECGSVANNRLKSPGYPNFYPSNMYCVYRVDISYNMDLNIFFNYFYLEQQSTCGYDYLKITNDRNQMIGKYCGQRTGLNVRIYGSSYVVLTFRSDGSVQRNGFDLSFYFVPSVGVSCNFDTGLCPGWRQSHSDDFDWTRRSGSTPSSNTGPSSDHTSGSGYYMYIETSSTQRGDNAKLQVSVPGNGTLGCLTFYYHMYGLTMGSLIVLSGNATVFKETGNHGNYWRNASITVTSGQTVTFEGIAGSPYTSDLAIDDVSIYNGSCLGSTPYPTTQRPSIGVPSSPSSPSPSPAGCSDKAGIDACNIFSTGNFCMIYFNFTKEFCRKTCRFCQVPTTPSVECVDAIVCPPSINHDFCLQYFNWSMQNCRKTCGFCGAPTSGSSNRTTAEPPTTSGSNNRTSTEPPTTSGSSNRTTAEPPTTSGSSNRTTAEPPTASGSNNRTSTEPQTTSGSSNRTTAEAPTTSEESTSAAQTPSVEEERKSAVMLRVSGLDIKKWNQKMKDAFKTQVASAATKHCAVDVVQCQVAQTRSRRRRSSGMTFTPDMVHILPEYPRESPDDPKITLLAFYLSLPKGVSGGTVVNKDVLQDIVKSDMSDIGKSMDSTIDSVAPVESTPDKLQKNNEDEKEDKQSKPTSLVIGASVGGVVFIALVAVFILGCKRKQRMVRTGRMDRKEDEDSHATNSTNATPRETPSNKTKVLHDHPGSVEQAVEMEEQGTPPSSVKQTHRQSPINTTSFQHPSKIEDHPESSVNQVCQEAEKNESVNHKKEAKSLENETEGNAENNTSDPIVDEQATSQNISEEVKEENLSVKSSKDTDEENQVGNLKSHPEANKEDRSKLPKVVVV